MANNELHVTYGEVLRIDEFRLFCLENNIADGVVYEDGTPYPMNEYAVWINQKCPKSLEDNSRIISKILSAQVQKRKAEKEKKLLDETE
jgi:hypothetical protein